VSEAPKERMDRKKIGPSLSKKIAGVWGDVGRDVEGARA